MRSDLAGRQHPVSPRITQARRGVRPGQISVTLALWFSLVVDLCLAIVEQEQILLDALLSVSPDTFPKVSQRSVYKWQDLTGNFIDQWIWWLGPFCGSRLLATSYHIAPPYHSSSPPLDSVYCPLNSWYE